MIRSVSHSQANQSRPAIVWENGSRCGTAWVSRINSPARMCHPVSLSISNRDELLTSRKRMISRQHPPSDGKSHRAAAPIFLFFDWLYRSALIAVVSFSICRITFFICHHSHSQLRQWQMKNVLWQTENASRHDFELVADFQRSA